MSGAADGWRREIADLHRFFEGWLAGSLPAPALARLDEALAGGFTYIGPDGAVRPRDEVMASMRQARGTRPGLRVRIENAALRHRLDPWLVATYEEWQEGAGETTARLSTAVLRGGAAAPHGVQWVHVHETWLRR